MVTGSRFGGVHHGTPPVSWGPGTVRCAAAVVLYPTRDRVPVRDRSHTLDPDRHSGAVIELPAVVRPPGCAAYSIGFYQ